MDESILEQISNLTWNSLDAFQNETGKSAEFIVGFINAIDWTQPWLLALMSFHVFCTVFIVLARHHVFNLLVPMFCMLFLLCFPAAYINEWAAENYRLFATEQYFDSSGMFITVLYSLPMVLNALLIVVLMLVEVSGMLVTVKRAELRAQIRRQEQSSAQGKESKESKKKK